MLCWFLIFNDLFNFFRNGKDFSCSSSERILDNYAYLLIGVGNVRIHIHRYINIIGIVLFCTFPLKVKW